MTQRWLSSAAATLAVAALSAGVASCEVEGEHREEPSPDAAPPAAPILLTPVQQLARISTAVRGVRPSEDDIARIAADPDALESVVTAYLDDEGFAQLVRDLFNEALDVRVGASVYPAGFPATGSLAGQDVQRINVSITEAPLRLIEHIVMNDRPLTEIVTADYTVADGVVATVWGLPHSADLEAWEPVRYEDGRPHAGVLSDSWLFTRHSTTFSNKNRGRANAVSRGLLCFDYLSRRIEADTSIDLADPEEVANAVRENDACASCHQTLDPLAAHFSAFRPLYVASQVEGYPHEFHLPDLSPLFRVREPGYFGYPVATLPALGAAIAEDPRFSLCMAKRFYAYFHQIDLASVPRSRAQALQRVLLESGSAKELARAVVLGEDFLASEGTGDREGTQTLLRVRPWQLARLVEDTTGFRWRTRLPYDLGWGRIGEVDLMSDSLFGFEVLAGGIDSVNVTLPAHTMTASAGLVVRGLSARAAAAVVDAERVDGAPRRLFGGLSAGDVSEAAVRGELAHLFLRLYGARVGAESEAITRAFALFEAALDHSGDEARAWETTLTALLSDARFLYY